MDEQKMTIKEIAAASGNTVKTVGSHANKLFPEIKKGRGFTRTYNQQQAILILESLPKKNIVVPQELREAGDEKGKPTVLERSNYLSQDQVMISVVNQMSENFQRLMENQQAFMKEVLAEIRQQPITSQPALPAPKQKTLPITKSRRSELVQIVRRKAYDLSMHESEAWSRLYTEAKYSYPLRIDIVTRAKNRNMKNLDYAEQENLIPQLIELAKEI